MANRFTLMLAVLAAGLCVVSLGACSGGTAGAGQAGPVGNAAAETAQSGAGGSAGGVGSPIDPCVKLSKADVQPFFTVPIATALPSALNTALSKGCTWSAADGSLETSVTLLVRTGDEASTEWQMADSGSAVKFSGVGDQAEHIPGISDFVSIKGSVVCSLTTVGRTHLAPLASLPRDASQLLSDSDATSVAQQFGTLCNKIFGSGNTTPTATAAAPTDSAADSSSPTVSVSVPAAGGTLGTTKFPLPQGVDCTGNVTVTDEDTSCSVTIDAADGASVYAFYLSVLGQDGYTINHQQTETSADGTVALILFSGGGFNAFSDINLVNKMLTIDLRS